MGRPQKVIIDGDSSDSVAVDSGVPQGSILGPLLFILFINDISNVISADTNILMYADDTKIWRIINEPSDACVLQDDIDNLYAWSVRNKIKFHPHKCKVISVTLKHNPFLTNYNMNGHCWE